MFRHSVALAALAFACLPGVAAAAEPSGPDPTVLRVCSGGKTGNYYFAAAEWLRRISHDLFKQAENISPSPPGSLTNLRLLSAGKCDLGMTQADVVTQYMVENPASRDTLSIFKVMYPEYVHFLCPAAMKAASLTEFADLKGARNLIVGPDGSGTAETWRIMWHVNEKRYGSIGRDDQPSDITSATTVMDSKDTCMMWVSGLNSGDMVAANQRSLSTRDGKPGLKLLSIDDPLFLKLRGIDGQPLYEATEVRPQQPSAGRPGLYNNLINNGNWYSNASITVLSVQSYMLIRKDYKDALGREKLGRISTALVDALPTVWARVNPSRQTQ